MYVQVVVFASHESHVAEQCDRLFPQLARLHPYAPSRGASFDSATSSRIASQHSSGLHGASHGSHSSSRDGRGSPDVPWSPSGWAGTGWPWVAAPSSGSAGEPQCDGSAQGRTGVHGHGPGGIGSRGTSSHGIAVDGAPIRRNMHTAILPAGYMPCKPQLGDTPPSMLPGAQGRRRVQAAGTDWVPVNRRSGFRGHEVGRSKELHPGSWRNGDPGGNHVGAVFDGFDSASGSWGVAARAPQPQAGTLGLGALGQGFRGQRAFLESRVDAWQAGPFPGFDDGSGSGSSGPPLWPQPHTKGRAQEPAWSWGALADDEKPLSWKIVKQHKASKAVGRPAGQLTEQLRAGGRARPSSARPPQHELEQTPRRQATGTSDAGAGRGVDAGLHSANGVEAGVEETPTLAPAERAATPATAAVCGSQGSATTGCSSSNVSFAAWTPAAGGASKPLAPNLGQHPWPLTMVAGTRDAAPPPPSRQCEVKVPSMREVAQLSAAVRRSLSLTGGKSARDDALPAHDCGVGVRKMAGRSQKAAAAGGSAGAHASVSSSVTACSAVPGQTTASTTPGGSAGGCTSVPELTLMEPDTTGDAVVDSTAQDTTGAAADASASLAWSAHPLCEPVRSPRGSDQEGQAVWQHAGQRPGRALAVGRELSDAAITQAREAAAQASYAAEACTTADKCHGAGGTKARLPRTGSPPSPGAKPAAASVPCVIPAVDAPTDVACGATRGGADVPCHDAITGLRDTHEQEHCGAGKRHEPRTAKVSPAPRPEAQNAAAPQGAAVGAAEPQQSAGDAPALGALHTRGGGLVVSTPPHFKSLPFSHHRQGPPKHSQAACRLQQPLQASMLPPAAGKAHASQMGHGADLHDTRANATSGYMHLPGTAEAAVGVHPCQVAVAMEFPLHNLQYCTVSSLLAWIIWS